MLSSLVPFDPRKLERTAAESINPSSRRRRLQRFSSEDLEVMLQHTEHIYCLEDPTRGSTPLHIFMYVYIFLSQCATVSASFSPSANFVTIYWGTKKQTNTTGKDGATLTSSQFAMRDTLAVVVARRLANTLECTTVSCFGICFCFLSLNK